MKSNGVVIALSYEIRNIIGKRLCWFVKNPTYLKGYNSSWNVSFD